MRTSGNQKPAALGRKEEEAFPANKASAAISSIRGGSRVLKGAQGGSRGSRGQGAQGGSKAVSLEVWALGALKVFGVRVAD